MSMEDIGVLRSIPEMVLYEPVDATQLAQASPQIVDYYGPVYIRMFRKVVEKDVFTAPDYQFDLFKADILQEGLDVSIFCSGIMVQDTVKANELLKAEGIQADIISIHTVKPIDREAVVASAKKTVLWSLRKIKTLLAAFARQLRRFWWRSVQFLSVQWV